MTQLLFTILLLVAGVALYRAMSRRSSTTVSRSAASDEANCAGDETFTAAMKYGREVEVSGESFTNSDGVARRDVIAALKVGDIVQLAREPDNRFDQNAIIVRSLEGVVGYVCARDAAEIAPWIDRGERVPAYIASIAGGPDRGVKDYGVWLRALSLEQLPQWIEERNAHRRKPKKQRDAEALARGWEIASKHPE